MNKAVMLPDEEWSQLLEVLGYVLDENGEFFLTKPLTPETTQKVQAIVDKMKAVLSSQIGYPGFPDLGMCTCDGSQAVCDNWPTPRSHAGKPCPNKQSAKRQPFCYECDR